MKFKQKEPFWSNKRTRYCLWKKFELYKSSGHSNEIWSGKGMIVKLSGARISLFLWCDCHLNKKMENHQHNVWFLRHMKCSRERENCWQEKRLRHTMGCAQKGGMWSTFSRSLASGGFDPSSRNLAMTVCLSSLSHPTLVELRGPWRNGSWN